jgi:fibronectin-binding autotransporter adhesin
MKHNRRIGLVALAVLVPACWGNAQTYFFNPAAAGTQNIQANPQFSLVPAGPFSANFVDASSITLGPVTTGQTLRVNSNTSVGTLTVLVGNTAVTNTISTLAGQNFSLGTLNFDRTNNTVGSIASTVTFNAVNFNNTPFNKTGVGTVNLTGAASGSISAITFASPSVNVNPTNIRSTLSLQSPQFTTSSTSITFDATGASGVTNPIQFTFGSTGSTNFSVGSLNTLGTGSNLVGFATANIPASTFTLNVSQTTNGVFNGSFTSGSNMVFNKAGAADLTWVANLSNNVLFNLNAGRWVVGTSVTGPNSGTNYATGNNFVPISVAATGTLASDISGRSIRAGSSAFNATTGVWTGTDDRGGIVVTAAPTSAIEPAGILGLNRLDATNGMTIRGDAANDRLAVFTLTAPAAAGNLRLDYSTFLTGTPGVTVTPLTFNTGSVPLASVDVTAPPFAKLDPAYGTGGILISGTSVSLRFTSIDIKSVTWTGGSTSDWNTTDANFAGDSSVYSETLGIGGALGTLRGDNVAFDDAGNPAVVIRPAGVIPSSLVINNSATTYNFSGGPIVGTTSLVKQGPGTIVLAASNTFAGGLQLQGGTVRLAALNAVGTAIPILSSGVTLGADVDYSLNSISTTGTLSLDVAATRTLTLTSNLTPVGSTPVLNKTGPGTLLLNATATYVGGTINVTGGTFALGASSALVNTITVSVTATGAIDASARPGGYTVGTGQFLNLNGGFTGNINVTNRLYHTNTAPLATTYNSSGTGRIDVFGGSTVTFNGTLAHTGLTTISWGAAVVNNPFLVPGSDIRVTGGIGGDTLLTLDAAASSSASTLVGSFRNVTVGHSPSTVSKLSLPPTDLAVNRQRVMIVQSALNLVDDGSGSFTGNVDLGNNALILKSGDLALARNAIAQWVAAGTYTGRGITASARGTGGRNDFAALAAILNTDSSGFPLFSSFLDQPVVTTDVLVRYTYLGDTNLDGLLDASDFNAVLNGITNSLTGWHNGDTNYDGVVDTTDYGNFLAAYNFYLGSPIPFGSGGTPGGAIPEPASLALILPAAALLARRRR